MSRPVSASHPDQRIPGKGVIILDKRRAGQCVVCFRTVDTHYVWRASVAPIAADQYKHDELLCDEHAEERMGL